ncbi:MAG: hypothetical protein F4Y03_00725 [Alphaproteobacteria bacterium]|nr:hypothetical protein [Alphaproteobacteria bacterium]
MQNAAAIRQETLERMRQQRADRRHQQTIAAGDRRHQQTLDATAGRDRIEVWDPETERNVIVSGADAVGREPARPAPGNVSTTTVYDPATGRDVIVPKSQAIGKEPGRGKPKGSGRLYVLSEDPVTGKRTYGTAEQALGEGAAAADDARVAAVDAAADDMSSWWPEWMGGKPNPTDDDRLRAYEIARKNPQMDGKEAMMRAMGMGGRGEESGQGGGGTPPDRSGSAGDVKQLPGQGTVDSPYQASTQADIELFKRTAPKGAYIRLPDGKVARKP